MISIGTIRYIGFEIGILGGKYLSQNKFMAASASVIRETGVENNAVHRIWNGALESAYIFTSVRATRSSLCSYRE